MSLYRKHRPQQFSDIVGQEHIKTTLANALKQGTFSHAYVFAGPKGSGKTTTARLLAKALNCSGRDIKDSIEPCEKCMSCTEVTKGQSMDVVEIDAASNRGIDEIRDLREKVRFAPTAGKYKVYVIDECHMLTKEAFNALLKTLEEPPAHAVFVLATTELHKVPATILSRAQLFDFKKAKIDEVMSLLESVAKKENIKIEPEALQLVARLAYGAYRDALTLLDQVASIKTDGQITLAQVQAVLGQATEQSVWDLVEALAQKDRSSALKIVNDVYTEGKDLAYYIGEVVELLRKIILVQAGLSNQFEVSHEEKTKIESFAQSFSSQELILAIQKMSAVINQVKSSILGQLPLEMVVFELTEIGESPKPQSPKPDIKKEEKIIKPEPAIEVKVEAKPEIKAEAEPEIKIESETAEVETESVESGPNEEKELQPDMKKAWPAIVKIVKAHNNAIAAMLRDTVIQEETEDSVRLGTKFKFQADQLCNAKIRPLIENAITQITGKTLRLDCQVDGDLKIEKPSEPEEELLNDAKAVFADI